MEINVKNYRGCESAELSLAPIALVCGHNEAGKTSIAQAVAAALTRNGSPLEGVPKNAARMLLRDGASRGNCRVFDETGFAQANWPGASVSEEGNAPKASAIAAGLTTLLDLKPADRTAMLIRVMDALPSRDQLQEAVNAAVASPSVVDAVWRVIETEGWDGAWRRSKTKGAELKGAWGQITGETWGAKKGEDWRPEILQGVDVEGLQEALSSASEALEEAITNQAADGARRKMLEEEVAAPIENSAPYLEAEKVAREEVTILRQKMSELPRPHRDQGEDCKCPHCGEGIVVVSRSDVRKPGAGLSDEENQKRAAEIDALAEKINAVDQRLADASRSLDRIAQAEHHQSRAKQELQSLSTGTVTQEEIQQLRESLQDAQLRVRAAEALQAATKRHRDILQNIALTAALAPDGLRQQVLAAKMASFNRTLALLSAEGGWPAVKVEDDISFTYGGRPYILLSASAQFRVLITLQLAIAGMDGSDAVIIDAADILDKKGRNGLFAAVRSTKLRALICMTMDEPAKVPDLSKAGIGRSYWIGGAVLAPIS